MSTTSERISRKPQLQLHRHAVGGDAPVLIVAECGINHNGSLARALEMIDAAAEAGADAVKFQLFRAAGMYTPRAGMYRTATGALVPIYELMEEVELPLEWLPELSKRCRAVGVDFIMTVCDEWCVAQMDNVDFDAYKIASYEITHLPMLREIARRKRPIFLSTGAATMEEVCEAMSVLSPNGERVVGLLQCAARYPTPKDALNLRVIATFAEAFPQAIPGFSDHSLDPVKAPVQAVFHGAKIIEKHFTLDRNLPGADHSFAAEPAHLRALVAAVREAEARLAEGDLPPLDPLLAGDGIKRVLPAEERLRRFAMRGIFSVREIQAGEPFSRTNIGVLRPGELPQGLHPRYYTALMAGARATRDIPAWKGLEWEDIVGGEQALSLSR